MFDTCGNETPFCLLIFRRDNPLLKSNYRKILYLTKNASRVSISPVKWTSKPESRQCNEKAGNLQPKSGDLAGLQSVFTVENCLHWNEWLIYNSNDYIRCNS